MKRASMDAPRDIRPSPATRVPFSTRPQQATPARPHAPARDWAFESPHLAQEVHGTVSAGDHDLAGPGGNNVGDTVIGDEQSAALALRVLQPQGGVSGARCDAPVGMHSQRVDIARMSFEDPRLSFGAKRMLYRTSLKGRVAIFVVVETGHANLCTTKDRCRALLEMAVPARRGRL